MRSLLPNSRSKRKRAKLRNAGEPADAEGGADVGADFGADVGADVGADAVGVGMVRPLERQVPRIKWSRSGAMGVLFSKACFLKLQQGTASPDEGSKNGFLGNQLLQRLLIPMQLLAVRRHLIGCRVQFVVQHPPLRLALHLQTYHAVQPQHLAPVRQ